MSRRFGILVLVLTFAYVGFVVSRLLPHHEAALRIRAHPNANLASVQHDLCGLAQAELRYQRLTGHYTSLHQLRSDRKSPLPPDSRWPYLYVLEMPSPDRFTIRAVAGEPAPNLPSMLSIDDQMQVQSRTKPAQIYPCPLIETSDTKPRPKPKFEAHEGR